MNVNTATKDAETALREFIGKSKETLLVDLVYQGNTNRALVKKVRNKIHIFIKPKETDMYSSWMILDGNMWNRNKNEPVMTWAYKNEEIMKQFEGSNVPGIIFNT
ncbi:hypothetical protein phiOC_p373 [Ochrobactrum phage vB_OspM_OC]|nr:hypothetical protein phiOC_p373 [Ochrobactrum phage vB_OspM_OC]